MGTPHPNTRRIQNVQSVEDRWHESLTQRDISEGDAEALILQIQSHPKLGLGNPSREEIKELTIESIHTVNLEQFGVHDVTELRRELINALCDGLNGNLLGPVSLPTPLHQQILNTQNTTRD